MGTPENMEEIVPTARANAAQSLSGQELYEATRHIVAACMAMRAPTVLETLFAAPDDITPEMQMIVDKVSKAVQDKYSISSRETSAYAAGATDTLSMVRVVMKSVMGKSALDLLLKHVAGICAQAQEDLIGEMEKLLQDEFGDLPE
jgi:predicted DNA-binding transcriptional regulator YafY